MIRALSELSERDSPPPAACPQSDPVWIHWGLLRALFGLSRALLELIRALSELSERASPPPSADPPPDPGWINERLIRALFGLIRALFKSSRTLTELIKAFTELRWEDWAELPRLRLLLLLRHLTV